MKKYFSTIKKKHLVFPFAALLFFACQLDVPVQEMSDARMSIDAAREVDAEKHASEELKTAEEMLAQSHKDLADEKADDAKASAIKAIEAANKAEDKSLPIFAQEKISAAEEKYNEADRLLASRFSPDKFTSAGEMITRAKSTYDSGEYYDAADIAKKALALATEACDDSMQNSSSLDNELSDAGTRLLGLKNDEMAGSIEEELQTASVALAQANDARDSRDFRTAYSELEKAGTALDQAEKSLKKKKLSAELSSLRTQLDAARNDKNPKTVTDDLDNAMLELNGAETAIEQDNITDAEIRINTARELLAGTEGKLKKNTADEALANAEKMLASAKEKDKSGKYGENLGKAETIIGEGKDLSASDNYTDAIAKADEAEAIITAVLSSIENDAAGANVSASDGTTDTGTGTGTDTAAADQGAQETKEQYYTVQWRKKDTDCLWRISQKVYNDASLWPLIYVANRDQIKNPDLIFPGQKFRIPPKPEKKPSRKELKEMIQKEKSKSGESTSK